MLNTFYDKFIFTGTLHFAHGNFSLLNMPFLISPIEVLKGVCSIQDINVLKNIYESVKQSTRANLISEFSFNFGLERKKELDLVIEYMQASGWGTIQVIDMQLEAKRAILVLENSPFATALKGKTQIPVDVLMRGVLAGTFSKIFEEDIDCVEAECNALNFERCKFIVKPKIEFDFTNKLVQDQLSHE